MAPRLLSPLAGAAAAFACLAVQALGAKELGVGDDYQHAALPPAVQQALADRGQGLLDGRLAWRQHAGGHTDVPNFKSFIAWADQQMGRAAH